MFFNSEKNGEFENFFSQCPNCEGVIYVSIKKYKRKCPKCSKSIDQKKMIPLSDNNERIEIRSRNIEVIRNLRKNYDVKNIGEKKYRTYCTTCGSEITFSFGVWNLSCDVCGETSSRSTSPPHPQSVAEEAENQPLLLLKGINGDVLLYSTKIIISRKKNIMTGLTQGFTKGDKTIYISSISGVQLKKPGSTNGYIQFTVSGGKENTGGVFSATQDENTVMFSSQSVEKTEKIRDKIDEIKESDQNPQRKQIEVNNKTDPVEEIRRYKSLLDDGIINQEEFDNKKKQLLNL